MVHDSHTLLKTTVSKVTVGTVNRDAKKLLDNGVQRSFITRELADKLEAKPYLKESNSMSALHATERAFNKLDFIFVHVVTEQDQKIPLRILVVLTIATPLYREHNSALSNIPHFKGLKLAHPVSSSGNFEIN